MCEAVEVGGDVLLTNSANDSRLLLAAAETGWDRPIPNCPDWDAAGLVRHTGGILEWMAAVVTSGTRVSRRSLDPAPENPRLASWYLTALDRTLGVLGSAESGVETWTFSSSGDRRVSWWWRRLAVEVAIHRFDVEHAVAADGGPPAGMVDREVAAAGVEEFVVEFLPGLLAQEGLARLRGTLHLHATDGPSEWWIDLDAGGAATPQHKDADVAVRGTRSDLLLWLVNREPSVRLEVLGDREVLAAWGQLRR